MTKTIIFSFFLVFLLSSCGTNKPARAKGIPENAFWAGGPDGGQWYLIDSINKSAKTINCKIYNDYTGELVIDKKFTLHCPSTDTEINWDDLEKEFRAYDGTTIYITTVDGYGKYCYFK